MNGQAHQYYANGLNQIVLHVSLLLRQPGLDDLPHHELPHVLHVLLGEVKLGTPEGHKQIIHWRGLLNVDMK